MTFPTTVGPVVTIPGGTGNSITPTLSTHIAGDVIEIWIGNTGNVTWNAPVGWSRRHQTAMGTSSNGCVGTLLYRLVLDTDTLPLPSPTCALGATVTRGAVSLTKRGSDINGVYISSSWAATGIANGTANPIRPPSVTAPVAEMLAHHYYAQRAATNAPEPTGYTEDQQIIISGTLVVNVSEKQVASASTLLSNQDVSPTSGGRWIGAIATTPPVPPPSEGFPYTGGGYYG